MPVEGFSQKLTKRKKESNFIYMGRKKELSREEIEKNLPDDKGI
jgi:hypothetical protein